MLGGSFPLFRIGGTLLQVHATFPLLLALVGYQGWQAGGLAGAIASIIFVLLLFVCVVLHEFGHVVAARRYGIRTPTVTLSPIGGIAALERSPEKASQEIVVALAGPAVTLAIAVLLYAVLGFAVDPGSLTRTQADVASMFGRLAMANAALLVFNLVPAFPMDGGRVLRGALTYWLGHQRATRVAARIGQGFALAFGVLGVLYDPLLLLVAVFVFLAAEAELRQATRSGRGNGPTAGEIRITNLRVLAADDTVATVASDLDAMGPSAFPVADAERRIVGAVTRERLAEAWAAGAHGARIGELMRPGMPTIRAATPVVQAYNAVMASDASLVGVVDDKGRLAGYLSKEHLLSMTPKQPAPRPTGPLIKS
jgi:Zn-dependent protease